MNRALLVGINAYPGAPLAGCVNDISDMAAHLVENCAFAQSDIRLLTDGRATTTAILDRLNWLVDGAKAGDRLYFWDSKRGIVGHTGIYLGKGYFEHSSRTHRGVDTDYLGDPKWMRILVAARR